MALNGSSFQRWLDVPEIVISQIFCPASRRGTWQLGLSLMCELFEAAFGLSDERPARIKLAWWKQEAEATIADRSDHPLSIALFESDDADPSTLPEAVWALNDALDLSRASSFEALIDQHLAWCRPLTQILRRDSTTSVNAANARVLAHWSVFWQLRYAMQPNRYGPGVMPMDLAAQFQLKTKQLTNVQEPERSAAVTALLRQFSGMRDSAALSPEFAALAAGIRVQAAAAKPWRAEAHADQLGAPYSAFRLTRRMSLLWQAWNSARKAKPHAVELQSFRSE